MTRNPPEKHLPQTAKVGCAFCKGTGKDPFDQLYPGSVCQVCNGRKEHYVHIPFQTCASCQGSGAAFSSQNNCTSCQGRGVVSLKHERHNKVPCPACQGKGLDSETGFPCTSCHGQGMKEIL